MPLPISTSRTASCCYVMCEQSGHSVCHVFGEYYTRLCAAAQLLADDPANLDHQAALKAVLHEETHFVHE